MTRLQKLYECLEIARKHKNSYMEGNILKEITAEQNNPTTNDFQKTTED